MCSVLSVPLINPPSWSSWLRPAKMEAAGVKMHADCAHTWLTLAVLGVMQWNLWFALWGKCFFPDTYSLCLPAFVVSNNVLSKMCSQAALCHCFARVLKLTKLLNPAFFFLPVCVNVRHHWPIALSSVDLPICLVCWCSPDLSTTFVLCNFFILISIPITNVFAGICNNIFQIRWVSLRLPSFPPLSARQW